MRRYAPLLTLPLLAVLLALMAPAGASAGAANAGLQGAPSDPLAGLVWGNYSGDQDEVFRPYNDSHGENRRLLAKIALRPRMRWFGAWYSNGYIRKFVGQYIANATHGDPNVMVQMAVFRLVPWEGAACKALPTADQQASYKQWIDEFAAGVGESRAAIVLQPDLPFAACVPHGSKIPLSLVAYAARKFGALPNASVYIDAGASDWPTTQEAVSQLQAAGVAYVRGFALGATHYARTSEELSFGAGVARALAARGIRNKHFVINTAQNGQGFRFHQYPQPATYDNAAVCQTKSQRVCVTLGIPPTSDVASSKWGFSKSLRALAEQYCDAYLWIGRPWLYNQAGQFDLGRSLALARTTPY